MIERLKPKDIDEYIATFPPEIQLILEKIRLTIREAVPGTEERISYQMPAFTLHGNLIYFAAFKKHIGMYPPVNGDEQLRQEVSRYRGERGNLKFPLAEPMPYDLISRIAKCRAKEHLEELASRRGKKKT